MAMMLAQRPSIHAMWPHWTHFYEKSLKELGLTHSRAAYPHSPAPRRDMLHAMPAAAEAFRHDDGDLT